MVSGRVVQGGGSRGEESGVERCQLRSAEGQRAHFGFSLRAFLRLEANRLETGTTWYEAKTAIIRDAIGSYFAHPLYQLVPTA